LDRNGPDSIGVVEIGMELNGKAARAGSGLGQEWRWMEPDRMGAAWQVWIGLGRSGLARNGRERQDANGAEGSRTYGK
jgi:hypothetical protein